MQDSPDLKHVARFGVFEVDLRTGELRKAGVKVRLQEQPFQVLAALLERPGELVTREELIQRLWPDGTVVEYEHSLSAAVSKVRQRLGDSTSAPRFIENVPRRGYRFIYPVDGGVYAVTQPTDNYEALSGRRRKRVVLALSLAAAAILFVTAGGMGVVWFRESPPLEESPLRKLALPVKEAVDKAAISPDGRQIAYVTGAGVLKVWDLHRYEPREIAGPAIAKGFTSALFWSPDSKFIIFQLGNELKKVPAVGGSAATLCKLPGQYLCGSWSPDGNSIVFGARSALYEVSAQGGEPKILVEPWDPSLPYLAAPQLLPSKDSRKLLYIAAGSGTNDAHVVAQDLSTGHREIVATGSSAVFGTPGHIVFRRFDPPSIMALPFSVADLRPTGKPFVIGPGEPPISISQDGTLVYSEPTTGHQQLVWLDRDGNRLKTIGPPQVQLGHPRLSPDGKLVAVTTGTNQGNRDIWVYGVDSSLKTRVTKHQGRDLWPVWSPDGKRLAFTSSRSGNRDIFMANSDGSGEVIAVLISTPEREYIADWSRDGETLLFMRMAPNESSDLSYLMRNPSRGDYKETPLLNSSANEEMPQLSPNGRLLAYVSNESGQQEIYLCQFPSTNGKRRVSLDGGTQPLWRADGLELYYLRGHTLMALPFSPGPLWTTGRPESLFEFEGFDPKVNSYTYDVSLDGQRFVSIEQVEDRTNIIRVTQNWHAEFDNR